MTTFIGTNGADTQLSGYDFLYGLDGDDHLVTNIAGLGGADGGRGNDTIGITSLTGTSYGTLHGGEGNDLAYGSQSADRLYGGDGNDILVGGNFYGLVSGQAVIGYLYPSGNDYLEGGDGADALYGGDGNDILLGGDGDDSYTFISPGILGISVAAGLYGGDGDDFIDGGRGLDFLYGGNGNDTLIGGEGIDVLIGEAGNDWMYGNSGDASFYGGTGNDVSVGDIYHDTAVMGEGDDISYGYAGDDYFYMGDGNDIMFGGEGVDVLLGEAGNDYFDGGTGTDYFFLGSGGNDTAYVQAGTGPKVIYDFEAGGTNDTLQIAGTYWTSLNDVLSHTFNMGSYSIIALSPGTVVWVIGVTPNQFTAADFGFLG